MHDEGMLEVHGAQGYGDGLQELGAFNQKMAGVPSDPVSEPAFHQVEAQSQTGSYPAGFVIHASEVHAEVVLGDPGAGGHGKAEGWEYMGECHQICLQNQQEAFQEKNEAQGCTVT